jgi:hypothetical protein
MRPNAPAISTKPKRITLTGIEMAVGKIKLLTASIAIIMTRELETNHA